MIEKLIDSCTEFAIQCLKEVKEFYPFGFALAKDGETVISIIESTKDEMPLSQDVIDSLKTTLSHHYPEHFFSAVAICVDVKAIHPTSGRKMDMIEVRLDSISTVSVNFYFPYNWEDGELVIHDHYPALGSYNFYFDHFGVTDQDLESEVYTVKAIVEGKAQVLSVIHDEEGNWQFLTGGDVSMDDLMMVTLGQVLKIDKSIVLIMNMPQQREAFRTDISGEWVVTPLSEQG